MDQTIYRIVCHDGYAWHDEFLTVEDARDHITRYESNCGCEELNHEIEQLIPLWTKVTE